MTLYRIIFSHMSPKDRKDGIETYVLADTEEQVAEWIDRKHHYGHWFDMDDPVEDGRIEHHLDSNPTPELLADCERLGIEVVTVYSEWDPERISFHQLLAPRKQIIMLYRGNFWDEEACNDAYYGAIQWGWKVLGECPNNTANELIEMGIAIDIREPS